MQNPFARWACCLFLKLSRKSGVLFGVRHLADWDPLAARGVNLDFWEVPATFHHHEFGVHSSLCDPQTITAQPV